MKALIGNGKKAGVGSSLSRGARQGGGNGRLFQRGGRGVGPRTGPASFVLNRTIRPRLGRGTR
jgi:hypothetical protein